MRYVPFVLFWLAGVTIHPVLLAAQEIVASGSDILKNPLDFNRPPTLPAIEGPAQSEIRDSIQRGVRFLLADQNPNGSWGSATRTKGLNIYAPVPGAHHAFRAATTSLCISALLEAASDDKDAQKAIERAENWLLEHLPNLRRATGKAIYNVWGHAYSIQALVRLHDYHQEHEQRQAALIELIRLQYDMLTRYESVDGGWGYYDFRYQANQPTSSSISFVNGTVLVALAEAKAIGVEPPERIVKRGIAALERQRKADFSYLYGEYLNDRPMRGINRPGGSLGRTQCCNCALRAWGDKKITDNVVKNWLYRLYVRNGWLDIGRKRPIPHESWMQVAGYFYYFGHYYAALSLDQLPASERAPYQPLLAKLMLDRQEKDGSWWDYPLYDYHQPYGTSFALMTLQRCLPENREDR
ncbi:MAG: terpene cyclase/mutase family protein [Fuerstiella sp.]|nr:terpene cyclase/mutase family protein [Fuerstiella sp.]MCP4853568.1 terpene cyclase/mutase family protein [Fuerstiella sp.]